MDENDQVICMYFMCHAKATTETNRNIRRWEKCTQ